MAWAEVLGLRWSHNSPSPLWAWLSDHSAVPHLHPSTTPLQSSVSLHTTQSLHSPLPCPLHPLLTHPISLTRRHMSSPAQPLHPHAGMQAHVSG